MTPATAGRRAAAFFAACLLIVHVAGAQEPCPTCDEKDDDAGGRMFMAESAAALPVEIYYDPACRKCVRFIEDEIPAAVRLSRIDVMTTAGMDALYKRLDGLGQGLRELPVVVVGGRAFQGLKEARSGLAAAAGEAVRPTPEGPDAGGRSPAIEATDLSLPAVLLAALADGVNPCAFSTILFLVSLLSLARRSRREVLLTGAVFASTVFVGYLAAGLGLYEILRRVAFFPGFADGFRYLLVGVLCLLSVLSLHDAYALARGRTRATLLKMPEAFRNRIHALARASVRGPALIGGTVALALAVTVFEFSCTGQVYLPVIMHLARTTTRLDAAAMLVLYNLVFLVPLFIVFGLAYAGVSSKTVEGLFRRHMGAVKVASALMFAVFAGLTLAV